MFIPSLVFVSAGVTVGRPVVLVTIAKWTEVEIIFKQGKIMAQKVSIWQNRTRNC